VLLALVRFYLVNNGGKSNQYLYQPQILESNLYYLLTN